MELRFQNGENVFRMVRDTVAEALRHKELIPKVELVEEERARKSVPEKRIPIPEPFEQNRMMQNRAEQSEQKRQQDSAGLFDPKRLAAGGADEFCAAGDARRIPDETRPGSSLH